MNIIKNRSVLFIVATMTFAPSFSMENDHKVSNDANRQIPTRSQTLYFSINSVVEPISQVIMPVVNYLTTPFTYIDATSELEVNQAKVQKENEKLLRAQKEAEIIEIEKSLAQIKNQEELEREKLKKLEVELASLKRAEENKKLEAEIALLKAQKMQQPVLSRTAQENIELEKQIESLKRAEEQRKLEAEIAVLREQQQQKASRAQKTKELEEQLQRAKRTKELEEQVQRAKRAKELEIEDKPVHKNEAGRLDGVKVITFSVAPHSGYGYPYDAFGILKVAPKFADWRLEVIRMVDGALVPGDYKQRYAYK